MGVFDGSIGAFVVGTVLACFLTGITSSQVLAYFQSFPNDRKLYKILVIFLAVMDWTHTAISCYTIWDWCVANFGVVEHLLVSPWSFAIDPAMVGVMSFTCQSFYAYRCYVVGKRKLAVPLIILLLSTVSLGFAFASTARIFQLKEFSRFTTFTYGVSTWLSLAALADLIITAFLVYHLNKSKTGLLHTNSMLNRLIELIVSTNGLTASVAVVDAILFGVLDTSWHVSANLALPKLYFNSLLVSLNARIELERRLNQSTSNHAESHGLAELSSPRFGGNKAKPDIRTALGFGREDMRPELVYPNRQHGRLWQGAQAGIQVLTHQTVIADGIPSSTYLPSESSDKELPFYSNEKDEEARGSPAHSSHSTSKDRSLRRGEGSV